MKATAPKKPTSAQANKQGAAGRAQKVKAIGGETAGNPAEVKLLLLLIQLG